MAEGSKIQSVAHLQAATGKSATFISTAPQGELAPYMYLTFERARWVKMGQPEDITISVEVGNTLDQQEE